MKMKFICILISYLNVRAINKRDFLDFFIHYEPMNISKILMIFEASTARGLLAVVSFIVLLISFTLFK